ncbi:hypothetical protein ACOME3_009340 [Neoechinorhynchus agilis]
MTIFDKKDAWVNPSDETLNQIRESLDSLLVTGEALIVIGKVDGEDIGLSEDDIENSLKTLSSIQTEMQIEQRVVQKFNCSGGTFGVRVLLRRLLDNRDDFLEIRIAVIGNVDSGKSTLLGVLAHDMLDDGRGLARLKLFRHKHEIQSGRTSSIGMEILGFDSEGNIVKSKSHSKTSAACWSNICEGSSTTLALFRNLQKEPLF